MKRTPMEIARGAAAADARYREAVRLVREQKRPSASFLQRRLDVPWPEALRLLDRMEKEGVISARDAEGKRQVIYSGGTA